MLCHIEFTQHGKTHHGASLRDAVSSLSQGQRSSHGPLPIAVLKTCCMFTSIRPQAVLDIMGGMTVREPSAFFNGMNAEVGTMLWSHISTVYGIYGNIDEHALVMYVNLIKAVLIPQLYTKYCMYCFCHTHETQGCHPILSNPTSFNISSNKIDTCPIDCHSK